MCFNTSQTEGQLNTVHTTKIKILLQREQIPSAQGPVFLCYKDHTQRTDTTTQNKEFSNISL